jgi:hypothetical protein
MFFPKKISLYNNTTVNRVSRVNKVKNIEYPICMDCKFFIPDNKFNDTAFSIQYAKCSLFSEKNLMTGEIRHNYASSCRFNDTDNSCGNTGKYFEPKMLN